MGEVAALVLAAGRATRFGAAAGEGGKLAALLDGVPLVRIAAMTALSSRAAPVIVVTGHGAERTRDALGPGLGCRLTHNPDYAAGMAGSLKAGIAALPPDAAGTLVLLADMPRVAAGTLDQLIDAFAPEEVDAVIPVFRGRQGNPVLIARSLFPRVMALEGDEGARRVLRTCRVLSREVDDPGILADVDTPDDLAALARG